ncbi:putative ferric-chelate reductase 1 isoform X1 [Sinocyclocheilus grahami]|uniref:Ferric chelate reductase 1 n=1 Tax=Sinocyclocheilus grahami TaxID=75366 RepID=A0A672SGE3_SINGR|nr:PREDICTED: putative ferric-chelate reductase 1 isoform X1 [Sinocyclocheilus grahami]
MEVLMNMRIALLLLSVCSETVFCFSHGKVEVACGDMTPQHDSDPSTKHPPFNIIADKSQFSPGDEIKVTLSMASSEGKHYFKGFLIEARNAGDLNEIVGSFKLISPGISQLLKCDNKEGSAVSHTSDSHKTEVQVIWVAPSDSPSSVQFLVTVARGYKEFWVKIPGPGVPQNGAAPPPQTTFGGSIGAQTTQTTTSTILSRSFTSEGCGGSKSCLRDPEGCDPQNDTACHFLSFSALGSSVTFELSGPAEGYVSFALSQDKWMGNDDVYLCIRDTDRVDIKAAYVFGRTHPIISSQNILKGIAWRLSDGVIQCSFRRDIHLPPENLNRFDLDQMYYLFMAHGRAEDGRTHRHDHQPLISTYRAAITGPLEDLTGSRSPLLIKYHGAFMLIAWTSTVSAGVIMARYFKPDWPERNILGQKVWFQLHRMLMTITVLLTLVGFVLPFMYRGGWSKRAGIHPYLGCVVMALAVIQPVMALFRPAPDASRRYIFNWMHFGTGRVAQVVAVVTIFLGIHQQALSLPAPWSTGVLAFLVVWFVLADLVLDVHRRGFLPIGKYLKNVKIYTEHINSDDKEEVVFVPDENETYSVESCFKNIVLAIYLCGNLGFLTTLLWSIRAV